jgi:hypothetical protein
VGRAGAGRDARTSRRNATRDRRVDRNTGSEPRSDGLVDDKPRFDGDKHRFVRRTCVFVAPIERRGASTRVSVALASTSKLRPDRSGPRTRPNEGSIGASELRIHRSVRSSSATSGARRREGRSKLVERTRERRMGGTLASSLRPNLRIRTRKQTAQSPDRRGRASEPRLRAKYRRERAFSALERSTFPKLLATKPELSSATSRRSSRRGTGTGLEPLLVQDEPLLVSHDPEG